MDELLRYFFAGFGVGFLVFFFIVWLFVFHPEDKKNDKAWKKLEEMRKKGEIHYD